MDTKAKKKKDHRPQVMTPENLEKFVKGEMTLAQLQGLSMRQIYAFAGMGHTLLTQGKTDDAIKIFKGLIVLNPYDPYFHSVMGAIYARDDQLDQALAEFSVAINLDFNDPQVYVNRAEIYIRKGQLQAAMDDLKQVAEIGKTRKHPSIMRAKALAQATARLVEQVIESKKP